MADIRAAMTIFAPLEIRGAKLQGYRLHNAQATAQGKIAVLLAGLFADGVTGVTEPARTRITPSWPSKNLARPSRKTTNHSNSWPRRRQRQRQTSRNPLDGCRRFVFAVFFIAAHPCSAIRRAHSQCRIESDQDSHSGCVCLDGRFNSDSRAKIAHGEVVGRFSSERFLAKGRVIEANRFSGDDELPMLASARTRRGHRDRGRRRIARERKVTASPLWPRICAGWARRWKTPDGLKVKDATQESCTGRDRARGDHRSPWRSPLRAWAADGNT